MKTEWRKVQRTLAKLILLISTKIVLTVHIYRIYLVKQINKEHDLDPIIVEKAVENIKLRYKYNYSIYDFMYNLMFPFKCIGRKWRKNTLNLHTRYLIFKKGESKFAKEFDVVEFAKTQRKLKMLVLSLMDDNKRYFASYQKLNAISLLSNSNSNESNDSESSKLPNLVSK